jgi:bifunctional ADP-heptose synthase (sugar kinase/adenylyltransferase)
VAAGGTLLCDSRFRLEGFRGVDGATPNEEEAERLLERTRNGAAPLAGRDDWRRAGAALRERLGVRFLLVTRGSAGMVLFEAGRCIHLPVHGTDQVADVTGAGDTVIGTFGLALAAGATPLEAALLANYAGGVVVMKRGTATLDRAELVAAVASDPGLLGQVRWEAC